ncbi:---NA--- [Podarcis lilfordi]|uniref:---NA n=1 Tax=Podarcis lilfordi TaxID=74358 RepID=A0AA35K439_9SAUR|nr:---NA--- [Podarcis lilfordi]
MSLRWLFMVALLFSEMLLSSAGKDYIIKGKEACIKEGGHCAGEFCPSGHTELKLCYDNVPCCIPS